MKKGDSVEANIIAAKLATQEMLRNWHLWKQAVEEEVKLRHIAAYAAAFVSCKGYLENYLKALYPNENQVPEEIHKDIHNIVSYLDVMEKTSDQRLRKAMEHIDQLSRDVA